MTIERPARLAAFVLCSLLATATLAQAKTREECERENDYKPFSGQEGKDVVWVPTPDELVMRMLRMGSVTAQDFHIDLGAGDGKIAIAAAKQFGAKSLGIEYNPKMVKLAQCLVMAEGVEGRAQVIEGDIFKFDFSKADVLTMYLLPKLNLCVRHRVLAMRPGVRVVSHQFTMGGWEPDESANQEFQAAYLWIVPARVGGKWSFTGVGEAAPKFTIDLTQDFQKVGGEASVDGKRQALLGAWLRGEDLRFAFLDDKGTAQTFAGKVKGKVIEGELSVDGLTRAHVTGSLLGEFKSDAWTKRAPDCEQYYGG